MEPLSDPCQDRPIKTHPPPPHRPLDHKLLFPDSLKRNGEEIPDWKYLKSHMS